MIRIKKDISTKVGKVIQVTMSQGNTELTLFNFGASIYSLKYKGKELTVRPDDLDGFLNAQFYYGKTVGRTGGRLLAPSYHIDGIEYPVKPYRGETTKLHGGKLGFSFRHFDLVSTEEKDGVNKVVFKIVSPDNEEDYPGELTLYVTYILDQNDTVRIEYQGNTTKDTLCSITNHIYFNLNGEGTINNHHMQIDASNYVELDENLVPLKKSTVEKTPFDLRKLTSLEGRLKSLDDTPIGGYDHTWLFDQKRGHALLLDDQKNIKVELTTDYPAVVVFAHNVPSTDVLPSRFGRGVRSAITLECEYEPGGIHFADMNSAILRKKDTYRHFMAFKLSETNK